MRAVKVLALVLVPDLALRAGGRPIDAARLGGALEQTFA